MNVMHKAQKTWIQNGASINGFPLRLPGRTNPESHTPIARGEKRMLNQIFCILLMFILKDINADNTVRHIVIPNGNMIRRFNDGNTPKVSLYYWLLLIFHLQAYEKNKIANYKGKNHKNQARNIHYNKTAHGLITRKSIHAIKSQSALFQFLKSQST